MKIIEKVTQWFARWLKAKPAPRLYSIHGWARGADGIYRSEGATISRESRRWFRNDAGEPPFFTSGPYPTLHAAIERRQPETPLLEGQATSLIDDLDV